MSTVTLSDTFQLLVPAEIRELMHLKAGAEFRVIPYAGRLEFVPIRKPSELRGMLRGMDATIEREDEDRL